MQIAVSANMCMCIVSEFPASFAANQFDDTSMRDKGIAFSHDGRVIVPYLHPDKGFIQVIFYIYIYMCVPKPISHSQVDIHCCW
jgi:hypothetical protein